MRFGRKREDGFLPVFSVGSEEEAVELLVLACSTNGHGEYVAEELTRDQTLDNLYKFGDRLREIHGRLLAGTERCHCRKVEKKPARNKRPRAKRGGLG